MVPVSLAIWHSKSLRFSYKLGSRRICSQRLDPAGSDKNHKGSYFSKKVGNVGRGMDHSLH